MPAPHLADRHLSQLSVKKTRVGGRIVVVAAIFSLLLVVWTAWGLWALRESELHKAGVATANVARGLAYHAETAIRGADLALEDMVERVEAEPRSQASLARLHAHLGMIARKATDLESLLVHDEHGAGLASSLARPVDSNIADRAYFQYHKTHPDRATQIGAPVRSKFSGKWIVPISRRLQYPDGAFAGVALATLQIDAFEDVYDELNLGRSGTVLLALGDGSLLYRRPFQENLIGTNISSGPVFQAYKNHGPAGTAEFAARIDGIQRIYSYHSTSKPSLIVAAGVTTEETLEDWKRLATAATIAMLGVLALAGYLTSRLLRQIAIRDRLEEGLREASRELQNANAELSALAWQDGLTGLANRRAFDDCLDRELRRAARSAAPVSLIMLDVDYFKRYNDSEGHPAGDECLRQLAAVLRDGIGRAGELAARYGGEEFAVVLPGVALDGAIALAERLRLGIAARALPHPGNPEGIVTISAGAASVQASRETAASARSLIKTADEMLYAAKQGGRNCVRPLRATAATQAAPGPAP